MRALRSLVSLPVLITTLAMVGCIADPDVSDDYVPCSEPAPLLGQFDPNAPGYIVVFEDDVEATEEAARMAAKYPIEVRSVYQHVFPGFYALMSEETVERIRCEATVDHVSHDGTGELGSPRG